MNYRAVVLSPVHIGDGRRLCPADFFVHRDTLVVFDLERWLAEKPERADGLDAALAKASPTAGLAALLTPEEQAKPEFRRYALVTAEFIRRRLSGEPPAASPAAAPVKPAVVAPPPPRIRTDLRGGLGGRIKLQIGNLPPGPVAVEKPKPAVVAKAPPPKPAAPEKAAPPPEPPPPERFVAAFVKSADDRGAYLPGSSIKGALRTAVLTELTAEHAGLREHLAGALRHSLNDFGFGSHAVDDEIASALAPERDRRRFDWLAALTIFDTAPAAADKALSVEMIRTLSPRTDDDGNPIGSRPMRERSDDRRAPRGGMGERGGMGGRRDAPRVEPGSPDFKGAPAYVEAVRARSEFAGRLSLDRTLFTGAAARALRWPAHLPEISVELVCKCAVGFARRVLAREADYFSGLEGDCGRVFAFYRELSNRIDRAGPRTAFVSLGFGAGWNRVTCGPALAALDGPDPIEIRKRFRLAAHRLRSRFPKTRRLAMETFTVPSAPPGWVQIDFD